MTLQREVSAAIKRFGLRALARACRLSTGALVGIRDHSARDSHVSTVEAFRKGRAKCEASPSATRRSKPRKDRRK